MKRTAARSTHILFHELDTRHPAFRSWWDFREGVLTAFIETDADRAAAHARRVVRRPRPDERDGYPEARRLIIWRLLSANNREIATGGTWFDSLVAAHEHAARTIDQLPRLEEWRTRGAVLDEHSWFLSHRGRVTLFSSHWFPSWRDRERSLAGVRGTLEAAIVAVSLSEPTPSREPASFREPPLVVPRRAEPDGGPPLIGIGIRRPIKEISRRQQARGRAS
jgi:hypothetical protein